MRTDPVDGGAATQRGRRPLRVAVVLDAAPPWSKGGRERRYEELLSRIAERAEVTVFSMRWWDAAPTGPIHYRAISPRLSLYRGGRRSIFQAVVFALGSVRLLWFPYDVLQADQMPYLHLFPLRVVAWIRRAPFVVDWHEFWGTDTWREYLGAGGAAAGWLERASLHLPDVVVAVTEDLAGVLVQCGANPDRVRVVSNGVARERAASTIPASQSPDVLFVGRLIDHKRADLAIEAVRELNQASEVTLGIVGVGPERPRLEAMIRASGLGGVVHLLGEVGDDELWRLLRGARVLAMPSEREGFGLTIAEALSVGTPVVTVDAPHNFGQRLVDEGRTGSVVAAGNVSQLADALRAWLDRSEDRARVQDRFWELNEQLDWSVSAKRYEAMLREVAS
jgi:glycosyltransferase involved in cell wall biosynthesis